MRNWKIKFKLISYLDFNFRVLLALLGLQLLAGSESDRGLVEGLVRGDGPIDELQKLF